MTDYFPARLALLKDALEANREERRAVLHVPALLSKNLLEATVIVRELAALNVEMLAAKEASEKSAIVVDTK